jgi:hypothetical protein
MLAELDVLAELVALSRLDAVEIESGNNVEAVGGSLVGNTPGGWGSEVSVLIVFVLLTLDALEVEADDDGRSCEKIRAFNEWNGAVEIENSSSAYLSISLVLVVELSEFDVHATHSSVEGKTGDEVEAIEGSSVFSFSLCLLIVLLLDELDVLAELDVRTILDVLAELGAVRVEANDSVLSIEGW